MAGARAQGGGYSCAEAKEAGHTCRGQGGRIRAVRVLSRSGFRTKRAERLATAALKSAGTAGTTPNGNGFKPSTLSPAAPFASRRARIACRPLRERRLASGPDMGGIDLAGRPSSRCIP